MAAKLKLYTNRHCPWAQRAHIALAELGIPYEEEQIDLTVPRTPEYLQINPRGQVPALAVNDSDIIIESAIVATYLADAHPSHLVPASNTPSGALARARIAFFVDTFMGKMPFTGLRQARTEAEEAEAVQKTVDVIRKEIEPLLVLTGSFVVRMWEWPQHGAYPSRLRTAITEQAPTYAAWAEAVAGHPSVAGTFDAATTSVLVKKAFGR